MRYVVKSFYLFAFVMIIICNSVFANPTLNHIMIIWGENANYGTSTAQPYLYQLLTTYTEFTDYHALTHPSEGNYIGFGCGCVAINADYANCQALTNTNLVDRLQASGVDWREYEENLVTHCTDNTHYVLKHDYFSNFTTVNTNTSLTNKVLSFDGNNPSTYTELTGDSPPALVMVTPNLCNDGHDCGMAQYNSWLRDSSFFQDMLSSKYYTDGAIFITMDENAGASGNRVYCVAVSVFAKRGYKDTGSYTHYSLTRTIEDNWSLPTLTTHDAGASNLLANAFDFTPVELSDWSAYIPDKKY